jgi:fibronectin type 3 domain-containing protein
MLLPQISESNARNSENKNVRRVLRGLFGVLCGLCLFAFVPAASAQSTHNVTLSWTYSQGTDLAVGFNVYRATTSGGIYTKLNTSPLSLATLTYQDFSGVGGTLYFYVTTAVDISSVESVNSNQVSATFIASSPNAPTGLAAVAH